MPGEVKSVTEAVEATEKFLEKLTRGMSTMRRVKFYEKLGELVDEELDEEEEEPEDSEDEPEEEEPE
jgi:hypothetical protein